MITNFLNISLKAKICLTCAITIMLSFFVVKTLLLFHIWEYSEFTNWYEYLSVILFMPPFFTVVVEFLAKAKKQISIKADLESLLNESCLVSKADKHGKITYVNDKFVAVSKYSREELIGQDHALLNSGVQDKQFWVNMYKTVIRDRQIWNEMVTNVNKDGEHYIVNSWIMAHFDDKDKLKGFTSVRQDVTDLKKMEYDMGERLKEMTCLQQVSSLSANKNLSINEYLELVTQTIPPAWQYPEITGGRITFDGITYRSGKENAVSDIQLEKLVIDGIERGMIEVFYSEKVKPEDEGSFLNEERNLIIGIGQKISTTIKNKELEKQTHAQKVYLEHAAKIIRHDMHSGINTYLPRGIKSLKRRLDDDKIKELKIQGPLQLIQDGLFHAQKVYNGVYEFTNLVKHNAQMSRTACDIKYILNDYLKLTAYKNQVLLDDNLPKDLFVNEALFCTAIDNLIRNGLKYNDSKTKYVKIYIENANNLTYLCIEDNGRGITQEEFEFLSQPYQRKEGQKEGGTGLGLNICIEILKEHGYEIKAEKLKLGTKLRIKI